MAETEQVQVTFTDDDSASQIAAKLVNALDSAFARATNKLGDRLEKPFVDMTKSAQKSGRSTSKVFDDINAAARKAARTMDSFATTMKGISSTTARTGSLLDPRVFDASNRTFNKLEESIERILRDFGQLATTKGGQRVLGNLTAAVRSQANQANVTQQSMTRVAETEAKARADAARVAQQRITALEVRASKERIVAAQQEGAQTLAAMRASASQRLAIIQSVSRQLATLQNNIGRVGQATARAFTAGISGIGNVFTGLVSRARSSTRQINTELRSTNSVLDRRTSVFRSAFSSQESILRSSVSKQVTQVERLDRALATGVLGAATGRSAAASSLGIGGIAAGIGGAGILTTLFTGGFQRASDIQRINKQFTAMLGNSEEAARGLFQEVAAFAKATPFNLVGVADLARGFLAVGQNAEQSMRSVKIVSDAVAFTGGTADNIDRIRLAIGQIVSIGRLQGDELNQLGENLGGLNLRKIIADELGVSTKKLVEMQEAGELTADVFVGALLNGLEKDPRIVGSSAALAKTLGGQAANAKESFEDLGATIILSVAKPLGVALGGMTSFFVTLGDLVRGATSDGQALSEVMQTVRTLLGGAFAGLGAIAGVKLLGEGLRLAALAASALLTPMGLVITVAAGLGAAFAYLMDNSIPFREAVGDIGEKLGNLARTGLEFAREKLAQFGDFLGNTVLPALVRFGDFVGENLLTGLRIAGDFISREVVPRLRAFASFITDDVVPAVRAGAARAFEILGEAVRDFWAFAEPVLDPAADAIGRLVESVRGLIALNPQAFFTTLGASVAGGLAGFAVAGPVGGLIGAAGGGLGALFAQGFGEEIVAGLQNIGSFIVEGLRSGLSVARGTLGRIFSVDNLIDFGFFAAEIAQRLGRVIGNALSDPRLVAGVAGVTGFALLAAGRFVIGFGQGVISNVPELASMLGDALQAALRAAISSLVRLDTGTIATAIAGLFFGAQALRAIRTASQTAGREASTSFTQAFARGSFGGAFAGGGRRGGFPGGSFLDGLFGGKDALARSLELQMASANSTALRETKRLNATLALAGRGVTLGTTTKGGFDQAVRSQYDRLIADVGPSGVLGLKLRAGMQAGWNSLTTLSSQPLRTFLSDMGVTGFQLAKAAGAKIAAGLAGGFAGIQVGRAVADADLLSQVTAIGGTALAIGAINPAAGAAAGALGVLSAALSSSGSAAEEAKERVDGYVQALHGIEDAQIDDALSSRFIDTLLDQGPDVLRILERAGFNAREFGTRLAEGSRGGTVEQLRLLDSLGLVDSALAEQVRRVSITEKNRGNIARDARRDVEDLGFEYDALVDALVLVGDQGSAAFQALDSAGLVEKLTSTKTAAEGIAPPLKSAIEQLQLFGTISVLGTQIATAETAQAANDAAREFDLARQAADDFLNGDYGNTLQGAIDELVLNLPSIESQLAGLGDLPTAVAEATRRQLGDSIQMDLRAAIRVGLETGEITNPTQYLTDLRAMIQALIDSGSIPANAGAAVLAEIDSLTASPTFAADMAALMQSIVTNGEPPVVPAPFTLDPQVSLTDDAQSRIGEQISTILGGIGSGGAFGMSRGLGGATGGKNKLGVNLELDPQITLAAGAEVAAAAAGAGLARSVAAGFTSAAGQIGTAAATGASFAAISILSAAGAYNSAGRLLTASFATGIRSGIGAAVAAAVALGAAASNAVRTNASNAFQAGVQIANGLAAGIRSATGAAVAAARAMAAQVAAATRNALGIFSPSRVFADIGAQIGAGLAQGIADSEGAITGAANRAVDAVVDAAASRADEIAAASASLFGLLQPSGANGVTATALTRQRLGLANLGAELQGVFQNSARTLWDAVVSTAEGSGDPLQQAINHQFAFFGENFGAGSQASLDPNFILGSMNVSGFLDAGEKIREFIETAVQSGADLGTVINEARSYREQLAGIALQYGANADSVNGLLDQLGISESALGTFAAQVEALRNQANQVRQPTPDAAAAEREREEAERAREEAERAAHEAEVAALKEQLRRQAIDTRPIEINVATPYGDPEAIGLGVVNRLAFELGR